MMVGAYIQFALVVSLGLDPALALPLTLVSASLFGAAIQRRPADIFPLPQ